MLRELCTKYLKKEKKRRLVVAEENLIRRLDLK
jgi:hypothetical protein